VGVYESGLKFLLKQGYREVYRPLAMQAPLWDLNVPQWVLERRSTLEADGVRFRAYEPELTLPLLEFAAREFMGDWVRVVRETAARILAGEPADRLIAAVENGQVVGFCHHDNERFGPIGVAQSQRGRGVGQVLMYEALSAMRQKGFRTAWFLWSDDKTAQRLYDAAGFVEVRRFALLRKELK
jgi:mycothiol synthase